MYAATGGPNVKWGGTDFKWGGGHHWPPRWRRPCTTQWQNHDCNNLRFCGVPCKGIQQNYWGRLTISSLFLLSTTELKANVVTVQADKLSTVLMTARWRSFPRAGTALKLGQYIHKNRVPEKCVAKLCYLVQYVEIHGTTVKVITSKLKDNKIYGNFNTIDLRKRFTQSSIGK